MAVKDLEIHETAAGIFVKSSKGSWWLKPEKNCYVLMHRGIGTNCGSEDTSYHKQSKKFKDKKEAYKYIRNHDKARYSGNEYSDRIYKAARENYVYICVHNLKKKKTYALKVKNGLKPAYITENLEKLRKDSRFVQVYVKSVLKGSRDIYYVEK